MAPRHRKSRTTRMDAAVDAMATFGFDQKVVIAKMNQLLKEYGGEDGYRFIELDAYRVLLEALLADQEQVAEGETSKANEMVQGEKVDEGHGFIDIPVCSSTPLTVPPPPPPKPQLLVSLPPRPPPILDALPPLPELPPPSPPPPPPPILDALPPLPELPPPPVIDAPPPPPENAQPRRRSQCQGWISDDDDDDAPPPPPPPPDGLPPLPELPPPPVIYAPPPPPENAQPRRRRPCHGWISDDDDEEWHFIILPSSINQPISPPETPPTQPELTGGRKNRPKRQSRWDLMPEDM